MEKSLMKIKFDMRFFCFLIKIQLIDRLATSAFLIGITLQTFLLCLSIYKGAENYNHGLILAIRSSLLITVGMTLLSSMSNIQNEFRFGTIESICLSSFSFKKLIYYRCISMAIICSPAILLPFAVIAFKFWSSVNLVIIVLIALVYVAITLVGVQTTFILNAFQSPINALPWIKGVLLILGMELIKFPFSDRIAKCFPFHWIFEMVKGERIIENLAFFILTSFVSTFFVKFLFRKDLDRKIESNFLTGRLS
jgi:hypothetical protein